MGKDARLRELEDSVHEAFAAASQHRKRLGLGAIHGPQFRRISQGQNKGAEVLMYQRQGGQRKGEWEQFKYRMTSWLTAADYATLLRLRAAVGFTGSPATLLVRLIRAADPARLRRSTLPVVPLAERLKLRNGHGRARAA